MDDECFVVLTDDEYEKAIGQLKLAEDFGLRIRGVDKPISIEYVRRNHQ